MCVCVCARARALVCVCTCAKKKGAYGEKKRKETAKGKKIEILRLRPQKVYKKTAILMYQVCELMY
jgi:phosphorylcholine metabolism protein LicD